MTGIPRGEAPRAPTSVRHQEQNPADDRPAPGDKVASRPQTRGRHESCVVSTSVGEQAPADLRTESPVSPLSRETPQAKWAAMLSRGMLGESGVTP